MSNNKRFLSFLIPSIFLIAGLIIIYRFNIFEFDPDEGINLMKALLVKHNYSLYSEIWSDQPPFLTYMLAGLFNIFEPRVDIARTLILLFSVVLIWENWLILFRFGGINAASVGSLLLIISPSYLKLSVSVMIGLPSLVLAMTAILFIIFWHEQKQNKWLIFSALCLSLSVVTKLFTFFLAPIIALGILIDGINNSHLVSWQKKLGSIILWSVSFLIFASLLIAVFIGYDNLSFLINNHTDARTISSFQNISLEDVIKPNYRIFLFGLTSLGILFTCYKKQWQMLYFAAWAIASCLLLQHHRPVWYHHGILVYLPAISLGGFALGEMITKSIRLGYSRRKSKTKVSFLIFSFIVLGCSILLIGEQTKTTFKAIDSWYEASISHLESSSIEQQFLREITKNNSSTKWMITDSPMFAFRGGIIVPPSTAVLSWKQLETGNITEDRLIEITKEYQPEQILLKRFELPKLIAFLEQKYDLKKQDRKTKLYLRSAN
ncbi:glycosyltransferase family 39 protein [Waterburya agarophytonicola K14]|uniref:Glycosyltransferase family 39 protein n=1 Tax=Waterburya agarophytonicola KI4 TaxID=2874699 RepID=A0A964FFF1_9CYAN|nr:glycosyltransferase family 39 protein [Waterburya agarophytonicola]MCC0175408.1 glycosyltransferase family 39 protein [Waterburya agarophytonicola KI4]